MVTSVAPPLAAWAAGINPGDVIEAIVGESIEAIVADTLARYNETGPAPVATILDGDGSEESSQADAETSPERDAFVRTAIEARLAGAVGSSVALTVRRTFRHIERTLQGRLRRHPDYDGRPVLRTFNLTRAKRSAPPHGTPGRAARAGCTRASFGAPVPGRPPEENCEQERENFSTGSRKVVALQ